MAKFCEKPVIDPEEDDGIERVFHLAPGFSVEIVILGTNLARCKVLGVGSGE